MSERQLEEWDKYLAERDLENEEPHSWFDIETNKHGHKEGLEKIFGCELSDSDYAYALNNLTE